MTTQQTSFVPCVCFAAFSRSIDRSLDASLRAGRRFLALAGMCVVSLLLLGAAPGHAQKIAKSPAAGDSIASAHGYSGGLHTSPLVIERVDEGKLVPLAGNTRSEANAVNDRGRVPDDLQLEHLQLLLQRPAALEQRLEKLIADLHRPGSPVYHQWLTAQQFGQRFGASPQDVEKLSNWLESHGFQVNAVYTGGTVIDFSGNAAQIREAFHTEIHNLDVEGKQHIANMSDPKIPAALAGAVKGVYSLHDFMPHSMLKKRSDFNSTCPASLCGTSTPYYLIAPPDMATIYNLNPAFAQGDTSTPRK